MTAIGRTPGPILAIDCGSTNLKAAVFDAALDRVAECAVPVRYTREGAEHTEFDPDVAWRSLVDLIGQTCRTAGVSAANLACVALGSQAQTFTMLDPSGAPVMPFLSWLDGRAVTESAELAARFGVEFHRHCSFAPPVPQLQVAKVLWVKRNHPEWMREGYTMVSLPGFFSRRLAGVDAIDDNLAGMGGLYSLKSRSWWPEMVSACGLHDIRLPDVVGVGSSLAAKDRCRELDLAPSVRIVLAGNDQTAGAFGNGCRADEILVTLGTALVAYRLCGKQPGPYHPSSCWGPYPDGGYYELATHSSGCVALDWARNELLPGGSVQDFDALAASAEPGSGGVEFHPGRLRTAQAWKGAGSPAQRARSVLEGIGFTVKRLVEDGLQARSNLSLVQVLGGGRKSAVWLEILAGIFNCPMRPAQGDSLLGAAAMAARRPVPEPSASSSALALPPPEAASVYRQAYEAWKRGE